ncbi:toll/interleukin-1 receptor domain-containing protein [Bradyrhizobium oligotrophicum]|uniref:toll/interleukin-1 receptor domain-containing protein n=1 Tax=Bradyrhizobium oligotrophicum TaxID=44255 RepID=UPI003EBFC65F
MQHDVFICHASEDKDLLVRPLAEALRAQQIDVWYDEFSIKVGGSLRQAIDHGLSGAKFGVVVLSPAFFAKSWTHWELNGLVSRMMRERRGLVLPLWHNVGPDEVGNYSPSLSDLRALQSKIGVEALCSEIIGVIRPKESPLLIAKAELLRLGWNPPPISDEWWLDMVEGQADLSWPMAEGPWLFPLPKRAENNDRARGLSIAWTALQLDWKDEAKQLKIGQTTHPERVLAFISENAALKEMCDEHPEVVANCAPQLLIPEFSGPFAGAFDTLLAASEKKIAQRPDSRYPLAVCEKYYALRRIDFGGHESKDVADKWINGRGMSDSAKQFAYSDYVFWLLSRDSEWMPERIRETLIDGMNASAVWDLDVVRDDIWPERFFDSLYARKITPGRWTKSLRAALEEAVLRTLHRLGVDEPVRPIAEKFIERDFVSGSYELRKVRRTGRLTARK